jgi:photosystem II stability/assembly factor-like uncharacterized protein
VTRVPSLALCLSLCAGAARAQTWQNLGPAPLSGFGGGTGRISAIAASRVNANLYYVAGADGGVWKTTDAGGHWASVTDSAETSAMGALALDPVNESIVYAGTGEANFANHSRYGLGLLKSTDAGATWTLLGNSVFGGRCFSRIVIDPTNTQRIFASITHAGGFPELAAAKGHPGASGPCGVFRSLDGGGTWTQLAGGLPNVDGTDLAIDASNPQVLYAAIGHIFGDPANGVYKSTDGGDTWTLLAGGLPTANVGRIALAIAPSSSQRLYALFVNTADAAGGSGSTLGGFRSDNGGSSWVPINPGSFQSSYGWYLCVVLVHPTNPNTVLMGGLDMRRSTNAGSSWSSVSPPHPDNHALAFDAAGNLLGGNDGGLHRSPNLGSSWTSLGAGLGTAQIYAGLSTHPTSPVVIFGGFQDNGTNLRIDNTQVWNSVLGGDGGWTEIDQVTGQMMFGESQGTGNLARSTDGGLSWNAAGNGLNGRNCFEPPYLIDPTNPMRMLYGTERVNQSLDGGQNWSPLSPDVTGGGGAAIRALAIAPSNSQFVYAATNDGRVLASSDGGATFALRLTNNPGWPRVTRELTVDPNDPLTVYLAVSAFGGPHIRRSRDAGVTWTTIDGNLPDVPVNVIGVDPRAPAPSLYAGTDTGVFRSVDDGVTWHRYLPGLPTCNVTDLRVEVPRGRLVIGTMGRGAWSAPLVNCYADFDGDGLITVNDYIAFQAAFAAQSPRANCDGSTSAPTLTVNDFVCFQSAAAAGCP